MMTVIINNAYRVAKMDKKAFNDENINKNNKKSNTLFIIYSDFKKKNVRFVRCKL